MKKKSTIATLLGVTQQDMARLLHINRSQWSMYESGKRDLPLAAMQLLAEILAYVNAPESANVPLLPQSIEKKQLERLLEENEFQQELVAQKIATLTNNRDSQLRRLRLQEYLMANDPENTFSLTLPNGMFAISEEESATQLVTLQLRQKVLVLEKGLIEGEIDSCNDVST